MKHLLWLALLTAASSPGNFAAAQDPGRNNTTAGDADKSKEKFIEQLKTCYHKHASAFVFAGNREGAKPFRLEPKPVLTWTSTGDALWSGDVFVWTAEGRPQVIGCIGSWLIDEETRGVFEELIVNFG